MFIPTIIVLRVMLMVLTSGIADLVRVLPTDISRGSLWRWILAGGAQVLRSGPVCLMDHWVVDFARVVAILGQSS